MSRICSMNEGKRNVYGIAVGKPERKRHVGW
jgi:hypothetical protein